MVPGLPDARKIYVERRAKIKGSTKDVGEILVSFNRTEDALHARDLDAVMALYTVWRNSESDARAEKTD